MKFISYFSDCRQAAKNALGSVITATRARELASSYAAAVPQLSSQLSALLVEGVLSEDYVLQVTATFIHSQR